MNRDDVVLVDREGAFSGYFRIDRLRLSIPLYAGGMSREFDRELLERGRVAAVLLVDPDRDAVVLIEQFRPGPYAAGHHPWMLEVVAGVIEGAESPEELVRRESMEEADCEVTGLFRIIDFFTTPGASTEHLTLLCGRVDSASAGGIHGLEEEGEDIRVMVMPIHDAIDLLDQGKIHNAKTIIALQWLAANHERLKDRWPA